MVHDICVRIQQVGDVYGSFIKSTATSIYLSDASIAKVGNTPIALFKISKKYVIEVTRVGIPSFEAFTDEQLGQVISLKIPAYAQAAQKLLDARKKTVVNTASEKSMGAKTRLEPKKVATFAQPDKKEWDQFEANRKLFGVEPKFNVDEYACQIDREAPEYASVEAQAQKVVRELSAEGTQLRKKEEMSEDLLYSSVQTTDKWDEGTDVKKVQGPEEKGAESKKPTDDVSKEIKQSYLDFQNEGWQAIAKLLNKKKTVAPEPEPAPVQVAKPSEKVVPEPVTQAQPATKGKKESESPTKLKVPAPEGGEGEKTKAQKNRDKAAQKAQKQHEQKTQKQVSVESLPKFGTASEIIHFIARNLASGHHDQKMSWPDAPGAKEVSFAHLKPLETFDFPVKKIEEIQKAQLDKKMYTTKTFK